MKMHKNCCHQSCSFWLRYAPNRLSAYSAPPYPLAGLGMGPGERKGGRGGEIEGGEGRGGSPGMPKSRVGKPNYTSEKAVKCEINIVLINRNHC